MLFPLSSDLRGDILIHKKGRRLGDPFVFLGV